MDFVLVEALISAGGDWIIPAQVLVQTGLARPSSFSLITRIHDQLSIHKQPSTSKEPHLLQNQNPLTPPAQH